MRELSDTFRLLFMAAKNLEAVHVGFSRDHYFPLDLGLEEIFHNVHWPKVEHLGFKPRRLDSQDNIARRHHRTLRGLRLRDVSLRDGSMWKDVLSMLREEMDNLEWVSLKQD